MPKRDEVIVLVGPMGVGKSTVGKKLARTLGVPFTDTDVMISKAHGNIDQIFAEQGEDKFREYELEALQSACAEPGVVATGGGAVLSHTAQAILDSVTVVYLATDGRHIASRLTPGNRPLLKNGMEDWKRIYDMRKSIYESVADVEINTSAQSLSATIAEIRSRLGV